MNISGSICELWLISAVVVGKIQALLEVKLWAGLSRTLDDVKLTCWRSFDKYHGILVKLPSKSVLKVLLSSVLLYIGYVPHGYGMVGTTLSKVPRVLSQHFNAPRS